MPQSSHSTTPATDGPSVRALHDLAVARADIADELRRAGKLSLSREHLAVAYALERTAAEATPVDKEPTRSVLLRSAASMARDLGWRGEMRALCDAVLASPCSPSSIVAEVEGLLAGRLP